MTVQFYGTQKPTEAPPPRAPRGVLGTVLKDMKPGQWYLIATSNQGSGPLQGMASAIRRLGGIATVRTSDGTSKLYAQRAETSARKAVR